MLVFIILVASRCAEMSSLMKVPTHLAPGPDNFRSYFAFKKTEMVAENKKNSKATKFSDRFKKKQNSGGSGDEAEGVWSLPKINTLLITIIFFGIVSVVVVLAVKEPSDVDPQVGYSRNKLGREDSGSVADLDSLKLRVGVLEARISWELLPEIWNLTSVLDKLVIQTRRLTSMEEMVVRLDDLQLQINQLQHQVDELEPQA